MRHAQNEKRRLDRAPAKAERQKLRKYRQHGGPQKRRAKLRARSEVDRSPRTNECARCVLGRPMQHSGAKVPPSSTRETMSMRDDGIQGGDHIDALFECSTDTGHQARRISGPARAKNSNAKHQVQPDEANQREAWCRHAAST